MGSAPPPPWPLLEEGSPTVAPPLAADELRLLWCPPGEDAALPRRPRIDALMRRVLAPLAGLPPAELRFGREYKGRPFLRHAGAPDFNLSDTDGGTLFAVTRAARVGVDLERRDRRPPVARLAARYFDAAEADALAALAPEHAAPAFIALWTAKEASCKATGTGIFGFLPLWRFAVGDGDPQLRGLPADAGEAARWSFLRVSPTPGHTAVLALRDAAPGLRVRAFGLAPR